MEPLDPQVQGERVALIGFGRMGERHASVFSRCVGRSRIVVWDSASGARTHASVQGYRVASSLQDALKRASSAVIATPNATHAELAEASLRHRRRTLLEKPMALTARDATRLSGLSRTYGPLYVAHSERFHPAIALLRAHVGTEPVKRITAIRHADVDPARTPDSLLVTHAIHDLDLVRWLGRRSISVHSSRYMSRDGLRLRLSDEAGPWAIIEVAKSKKPVRAIRIYTEARMFEANLLASSLIVSCAQTHATILARFAPGDGLFEQARAFAFSGDSERETSNDALCPASDAAAVLDLALAAQRMLADDVDMRESAPAE